MRCSDEMLDVLVQRVGMKEGSTLMLKSGVRCVRDYRAQERLLWVWVLPLILTVGFFSPFLLLPY